MMCVQNTVSESGLSFTIMDVCVRSDDEKLLVCTVVRYKQYLYHNLLNRFTEYHVYWILQKIFSLRTIVDSMIK